MKKLLCVIFSIVMLFSSFAFCAEAETGANSFIEKESNNSFATADIIRKDYTVSGTINGEYDMDYFQFTLTSAAEVYVLTSCESEKLFIGIYDSDDNLVTVGLSTYNNGYYHRTIEETLPEGTYYLLLLQSSTYSSLTYAFYFDYEVSGYGSSYDDSTDDDYSDDETTSHVHNYSSKNYDATCTEDGYIEYTCACGDSYIEDRIAALGHNWGKWEIYEDEQVKYRVCYNCYEKEASAVESEPEEEEDPEICINHNYKETAVKATMSADGYKKYVCENCGYSYQNTISKISSVKLSSAEFTYNGKQKTPGVTVTAADKKELVKGTDYTVTYDSERKMPGEYKVTVSFKGNYEGSKTLKFTIKPKAVKDLKAKEKTSKSITLAWSKTTGATGYKIYQYNSSKGKYVEKKSTTSLKYKATGLKENTTYKFKVRPYTKTKDGTVIWGDYSAVLKAKTAVGYSVVISGSSATLTVGKTKQLSAKTTPADKKITWKSSKTSVATVSSSGLITAKKPGTATITASFKYKDKTYKDTYKVTVKAYLGVSKKSLTVKKGEKKQITVTGDNYIESISYKIIEGGSAIDCSWGEWEGNKIKLYVTGVYDGTAKIKIYDSNDENNSITVKVTVKGTASNSSGNALPPNKNNDISSSVSNATSSYETRLTYENSVPKLDWKANEAKMKLLVIIAKDLDVNYKYTQSIKNATSSYETRLTYENSVPKLNWKANEACMKLLVIIAKELNSSGSYTQSISNATSSYEIRLTYEDSVPKLDWKANEACMKLLVVIAKELNH